MYSKDIYNFLGLNQKQIKVLKSLAASYKSIFQLSEDTEIPRGTLYPIIENLYQRDLITVKKSGERFFYQGIQPEALLKMFLEIQNQIN